MYSKFPVSLSLERLPRARRCGCLSLRASCVLTALVCILYSVLALSQCIAEAAGAGAERGEQWAGLQWAWFSTLVLVLVTSLSLSALMLVGALRDKPWMMRPWVVFKALQLGGALLLLVVGGVLRPAPLALPAPLAPQPVLLSLVVEFLVILVRFYMLTIVASHCQQLEDEELTTPLRPGGEEGAGGGVQEALYADII